MFECFIHQLIADALILIHRRRIVVEDDEVEDRLAGKPAVIGIWKRQLVEWQ